MTWPVFRTIIWFVCGVIWAVVFGMELSSYLRHENKGFLILLLDAVLAVVCIINGFMLFFNF